MRRSAIVWLLCAALMMLGISPVYAGNGHRGPGHHHHYDNDWGWFIGLSTLVLLPEIIRQTQPTLPAPYPPEPPVYAPYVPELNWAPTTAAVNDVTVVDQYADNHNNGQTNLASSSVSIERPSMQSGVRSLPANARVIQTPHGTEYEWLGQRYHYNWQSELYVPVSN